MRVMTATLGAIALTLTACGGSGSTDPGGQGAQPSVSITVASTIASGTSAQASATLNDGSGHTSTPSSVAWSSSDPAVANVNGSGLVTGHRVGYATLRATVGAVIGTYLVHVSAGPPARVTIYTGDNQTADRGTPVSEPLCVQVLDAEGNPVPGVVANYNVATGAGTLGDPTNPVSGGDGVAISGFWRLGANAGQQTVNATVPGVGSVTFKATAR
jgi:hypothetical protein